jgi:Omp85 superfamily domain/Glycogen recognition site of AMP-activated protein kinase
MNWKWRHTLITVVLIGMFGILPSESFAGRIEVLAPSLAVDSDRDDGESGITIRINDKDERNSRWSDRRYAPRNRNGRIEFRYEDDNYDRVYISGEFNDWTKERMKHDFESDFWYITMELEEGWYQYQFVVKEDDETWRAMDPSVKDAVKHRDHGWVSEVEVNANRQLSLGIGIASDDFNDVLDWDQEEQGTTMAYQRVDGLFLSTALAFTPSHSFEPAVRGRIGYGFESKEWSSSLTILQPLVKNNLLSLKMAAYAKTDFTDQTGIGSFENTLAMALFKNDFRDYYRREGATFGLVFSDFDWFHVESGIKVDDYTSMEQKAKWSVWGDDVEPNPEIDEGTFRSVYAQAKLGRRHNYFSLLYERCDNDIMTNAYEFEQITATYRARLHLGYRRFIDLRIKGGTALSGVLPVQKRYHLGGLGTIRGYEYQSLLQHDCGDPVVGSEVPFGAQKMLMGTIEHVLDLDWDWDTGTALAVFADAGMAWTDRNADVKLEDLKCSAGIGFLLGDGLRVDLVKTLDGGDDDAKVYVRLKCIF